MRSKRLLRITRLAILLTLLGCLAAAAAGEERGLPADVGTNHLGVLQPDWPIEYPGGWVRLHPGPFIWGWVERTPGNYDWREPDLAVEKQQGRRMAILATIWPFATWDQIRCHGSQPHARGAFGEFGDLLYAPCDMDAYLSWLGAMVERYDGDGIDDMPGLPYPILHWEVLNEPEMQGAELCFFQEEPEVYGELLTRSYAAIKAADPLAVVLPAGQSGMHPEATDYWRPILSDAGGPFDIAHIHSIRCSDLQEDAAYWAPEYVDLLLATGRGDIPYWITEAQTGSVDPKYGVDEDRDEQDLFIGTVAAFAEGADLIFHVLAHDPLGQKTQPKVGISNLLGAMIGAFVSAERSGPNTVQFTMPDGSTIYALWGGARLPSKIAGNVHVTTHLGKGFHAKAGSIVADTPILVEIP